MFRKSRIRLGLEAILVTHFSQPTSFPIETMQERYVKEGLPKRLDLIRDNWSLKLLKSNWHNRAKQQRWKVLQKRYSAKKQ